MCVIWHQCVLLLVRILLARVRSISMCPNSYGTTVEAGNAAARTAAVWLFWGSNRDHTTSSFLSFVRLPRLSMYVRIYRNSINKCTTMIPTSTPCFLLKVKTFVLGQNVTPTWQ